MLFICKDLCLDNQIVSLLVLLYGILNFIRTLFFKFSRHFSSAPTRGCDAYIILCILKYMKL